MSKQTDYRLFPVVRAGYRPDQQFATGLDASGAIDGGGQANVTLTVRGEGPDGPQTADVSTTLTVYGPGEVTAIDTDQIVRMEPEPSTTEFPPNYFPHVEFDDPRLPWQFSPEQSDDHGRVRPWLCLVVVEEDASTLDPPGTGPLAELTTTADQLPDPAESWAWAHSQLIGSGDPNDVFDGRSARTVSRLLCPRNLDPKTSYRACLVPTFEPGRRAGLGLEPYPDGRSNVGFAWSEGEVTLPVYHHWTFTSAKRGDFESLARELEQRTFGDDVGFRTVDVSNPGPESLKPASGADTDTATVGVGGALKTINAQPDGYDEALTTELRELLNNPSTVSQQTDYGAVGPPLYGRYHAGVAFLEPPEMDTEEYYYPRWFNELNDDPRNRIAAGYGTQVVRSHQQGLMQRAWDQFPEIQAVNRKLKRAQFAEKVAERKHDKLDSLSTGTLLGLTGPIHGELFDETAGETIYSKGVETDLPAEVASPAFRRITRPTGPLARRPGTTIDPASFATRLETGRVPKEGSGVGTTTDLAPAGADGTSAESGEGDGPAPAPGQTPSGPQTDASNSSERPQASGTTPAERQSAGASEADHPSFDRVFVLLDSVEEYVNAAESDVLELESAVQRHDWQAVRSIITETPTLQDRTEALGTDTFGPLTRTLSKLLAEEPEELPGTIDRQQATTRLQTLRSARRDLADAVGAIVADLRTRLSEPNKDDGRKQRPDSQLPRELRRQFDTVEQSLDELRTTVEKLRSEVDPTRGLDALTVESVTMESVEASGEELAAPEVEFGSDQPPAPTELDMADMERVREATLSGLAPSERIHSTVSERLGLPNLLQREDPVEEVMAAPTFDDFTYKLLAELNQEYFLPGAGDIEKNSMGVLQTNPEFIEAFLAGLNHEMARELRWRRYPTDRRGTYFRRFWDRRANPDVDPSNPDEMADIEKLHTWDENPLGENSPGEDSAQVVLLIKGELLRRYPNTDIFAAKAVEDEGDRVPALPNTHVTRKLAEGEASAPGVDPTDLKYPVFRGRLDPDITFFGFDITPDEALYEPYHSDQTKPPDDHPDEGWFFVLQEPPGETRFGLDVGTEDDVGERPPGIAAGSGPPAKATEKEVRGGVEHGVNAVSWSHLIAEGSPDDVTHVSVSDSQPGREDWSVEAGTTYVDANSSVESDHQYDDVDAATWGYNSAHMARFTWQLPVRVSVHADDMITEDSASAWRTAHTESVRYWGGGR